MIKKFEEFISEGMWKSGLDRAKSGTIRLEDIDNTNLIDIEVTDFVLFDDMYFADRDLVLSGEKKITTFTKDQMQKMIKIAERSGWRLPTCEEINHNLLYGNKTLDTRVYTSKVKWFNPTGGEILIYDFNSTKNPYLEISFPRNDMLPIPYWLEDGEMQIGIKGSKRYKVEINVSKEITNKPKRIRFIKQR